MSAMAERSQGLGLGTTFEQDAKMRLIEHYDPAAKILGWHYPTGGPMIARSNGHWQAIEPSGRVRTLVRGSALDDLQIEEEHDPAGS